ncbi:MAG: aminotransferase class I/II-fold pyridoxal phosphate-dependent enzyme [Gaiellaceae bacterium]
MQLSPDGLNAWLNEHHFAAPPIEFDLGASTGPIWTVRDLLARGKPDEQRRLLDLPISYAHSRGSHALRTAIAAHASVEPDQVQVTTGGAEALWIIFLLAAEPSANVVVPERPSFPTFNEAPRALGMEVRNYRLRRKDDYDLDVGEIRGLIDGNTKLLVVNRPQNPTGAVVTDSQLAELHRLTVERGVQLVVDEVFHPIYHGPPVTSAARLPGTTVVGDFSKALCLSGLRLGWIIERDSERIERYEHARSYFTVSSSPVSEALGVLALRQSDQIYARARSVTRKNLALLGEFIDRHSEQLAWVRPAGGCTAFPWLVSGRSSRDFCRQAAAAGVLLAPGDLFGAPEHFRIGFGACDRFSEGIERLSELVTNSASLGRASHAVP